MKKFIINTLGILMILIVVMSCGKKKSPFLLLPLGDSNTSQYNPPKGNIPLNYVDNTTSINNSSTSSNNSNASNNTSINNTSNTNSDNSNQNNNTSTGNTSNANSDMNNVNDNSSTNNTSDTTSANNNVDNNSSNNNTSSDTNNSNEGSSQDNNTSLEGTVTINDQTGNQEFNFNTTITIGITITVVDPSGPVAGVIINVTDPNLADTIIFQGVTNENGVLTGNITIPTALETININAFIGEHSAVQTVQIRQGNEYIIFIDRQIAFNQEVDQHIQQIVDSDSDGIPDELDAYPDDPTRATRVVLPNSGTAIVAYEDLYPNKGDADFNDVVLQVVNEEDLNANGEVVRIRGRYKLLAKGAGYAHVIFLNLPGSGTYQTKVYDGNNNLVAQVSKSLSSLQQLPIFMKNDRFFDDRKINDSTLYFTNQLCAGMCNVYNNRPYTSSYSAEIEVIFNEPQSKVNLLSAPYDLYIYVNNTRKEIHFAGLYKNSNGRDLYLDSDGFPWALQIPVEWNWPLERNKIFDAYPFFTTWYQSEGQQYQDWYVRFDDNSKRYQYLYFNISPISAFFLQFGGTHPSIIWTFFAIFLSGVLVFLFIKGRTKYEV